MKKIVYCLLILVTYWGCANKSQTEKRQNRRNNSINVREKIKEIEINDILIGAVARLYLIDNYLVIGDHRSTNKLVHLIDKNKFSYVLSFANKGQGPGEITNMGHIETNQEYRLMYVSDHGKQAVFSYELDSILVDTLYMPQVKAKMRESQFPDRYQYINDTLSIGLIIEPTGNSGFKQLVAGWNMTTGKIKPMKYEHPGIDKKRVTLAVSVKNNIYVECYSNRDLMTICTLNGDLKYNIYGPDWSSRKDQIHCYGKVIFCNNRILVSYSGGNNLSEEYYPTKFIVFDVNGDYIQTLDAGCKISDYCYDEENNRLIMNLEDEMQFAYLDLEGIMNQDE